MVLYAFLIQLSGRQPFSFFKGSSCPYPVLRHHGLQIIVEGIPVRPKRQHHIGLKGETGVALLLQGTREKRVPLLQVFDQNAVGAPSFRLQRAGQALEALVEQGHRPIRVQAGEVKNKGMLAGKLSGPANDQFKVETAGKGSLYPMPKPAHDVAFRCLLQRLYLPQRTEFHQLASGLAHHLFILIEQQICVFHTLRRRLFLGAQVGAAHHLLALGQQFVPKAGKVGCRAVNGQLNTRNRQGPNGRRIR